jgi:hypothetical protein
MLLVIIGLAPGVKMQLIKLSELFEQYVWSTYICIYVLQVGRPKA